MTLKNVLRRRPSTPARNVVIRKNVNTPRNMNVVPRNNSPRKPMLSKAQITRIIWLIVNLVAIYYVVQYSRNLSQTNAMRLRGKFLSFADKFTAVLGTTFKPWERDIQATASALMHVIVSKLQRGTLRINMTNLMTGATAYAAARRNITSITSLKNRLETYNTSIWSKFRFNQSSESIRTIIIQMITYLVSLLRLFASQTTVEIVIDELKRRKKIGNRGALRIEQAKGLLLLM